MKKFRGSVIAIVAASALTCAALVMAQTERPITDLSPLLKTQSLIYQSPSDERAIGVDVVRLINSAEMEYKHAHGGYATWPELYRSGVIAKHQKAWPQFSNLGLSEEPEVVPGWTLAMLVSADAQSYELSLRNLHDRCQFSLFSDQRELIYRGVVIDCGPAVVPAHQ